MEITIGINRKNKGKIIPKVEFILGSTQKSCNVEKIRKKSKNPKKGVDKSRRIWYIKQALKRAGAKKLRKPWGARIAGLSGRKSQKTF